MEQPHWISIASREIGVKTFPVGDSNPRITEYHSDTNVAGYDDKVAWCSSFINWVFIKAGYQGTNSALARSWIHWGKELKDPRSGCVAILEREGQDGWQGNVGFFIKIEHDRVFLLGGNQLDEVCEHSYPISTILGYRWPDEHCSLPPQPQT